MGFNQFLGVGDSLLAELWAAFLGIKLALSHGVSNIWVESDCLVLVNLFRNDTDLHLHHLALLINSCRSLLSHFNNHKISHVLREGNQVTDMLAGAALHSRTQFTSYSSCPSFVSVMFVADRFGTIFPRGIG